MPRESPSFVSRMCEISLANIVIPRILSSARPPPPPHSNVTLSLIQIQILASIDHIPDFCRAIIAREPYRSRFNNESSAFSASPQNQCTAIEMQLRNERLKLRYLRLWQRAGTSEGSEFFKVCHIVMKLNVKVTHGVCEINAIGARAVAIHCKVHFGERVTSLRGGRSGAAIGRRVSHTHRNPLYYTEYICVYTSVHSAVPCKLSDDDTLPLSNSEIPRTGRERERKDEGK